MQENVKTCFIIMPIADHDNYLPGHFKRVYDYIIKPACSKAGFIPIRADEVLTTNYIALDILKKIIASDMAICDISSRNPNVFYELGIRQAFNLPVSLIRDSITNRIFDIQGFRDMEYDESLRIDSVNANIDQLSELISNTYANKEQEVNSLITLLGIEPAKVLEKKEISLDTELILNSLSSIEKRISNIEFPRNVKKPENIYRIFEASNISEGMKVNHPKFGIGTILKIEKRSKETIILIDFDNAGTKNLILEYAKLELLEENSL